jgi:NAD(P)-dependent dehydrogenase (short-subunit alcohol dehydrogenase family)
LINYTHLTKELKTMKIAVVDGQGGGIGSAVIKRLREEFGESVQIIALGTNSIATAQMIKARANKGATGENAIIQTASKMDVIVGPIGIVLAQAMMGEVSPAIAQAVAECPALKLLIPLSQENVEIMGFVSEPLPHLVDKVIQRLKEVQQNV